MSLLKKVPGGGSEPLYIYIYLSRYMVSSISGKRLSFLYYLAFMNILRSTLDGHVLFLKLSLSK